MVFESLKEKKNYNRWLERVNHKAILTKALVGNNYQTFINWVHRQHVLHFFNMYFTRPENKTAASSITASARISWVRGSGKMHFAQRLSL